MTTESQAVRELREALDYVCQNFLAIESREEEAFRKATDAVLSELAAAKLDIVAITNQRNTAQSEAAKLRTELAACQAFRKQDAELAAAHIDAANKERNAAQAACAEMREALGKAASQLQWVMESTQDSRPCQAYFKAIEVWKKYPDCGRGYVSAAELEPTIALLLDYIGCTVGECEFVGLVRRELARLEALKGATR